MIAKPDLAPAPSAPAAPLRRPAPVAWDVYEEHFDEASFLWRGWEEALVAANYTLGDVTVGPEARLLAHLDGLVLGGRPVAERMLLPALAADEPEPITVAAWVLAQAEGNPAAGGEGADYQEAIIAALTVAEPPARAAIARALRLAPRTDLSRVARLWQTGSPEMRVLAFELLHASEPSWAREKIDALLRSGDSAARAAGLRALRAAPDPALRNLIEQALQDEVQEVRHQAVTTGIVHGVPAAWDQCRVVALRGGETARLPLALLATSSSPKDRGIVAAFTRDPKVKRHAVWALGFAGDREAVDLLVEALADEEVAKVAAEAISASTGIAIAGALATRGETEGPGTGDLADDAPPPIVRTEDDLLPPNPAAVTEWWQQERTRFAPGVRHILGQPRTPQAMRAGLETATMWRREVLALELAAATGSGVAVDVRAWTRDQRRALSAPPERPQAVAARRR